MNNKSHEFAFYSEEFCAAVKEKKKQATITDGTLLHRLQHVVRAAVGETVLLFDNAVHARCTVSEYLKGRVVLVIGALEKNMTVVPRITALLPLLKREALDELVYACRELGVTEIIFVSTDKSSRHTLTLAERERLERVSIAAAEQSKNFAPCTFRISPGQEAVPTLGAVLATQKQSPEFADAVKLYADPSGSSWQSLITHAAFQKGPFVVCVGPEGDMSDREKQLLRDAGFIFCKLGGTILRAQQAAVVLIGTVRAFFQD